LFQFVFIKMLKVTKAENYLLERKLK